MQEEVNDLKKATKTTNNIVYVIFILISIAVGIGSYIKGVSDVSTLKDDIKRLQENYQILDNKLLSIEKSNYMVSDSIKYYEKEISTHCPDRISRMMSELCKDLDRKLYELQSKKNVK
ncbi:hypothetical protein X808_17650 [Mannheimia varigena USDA-ARS-USMARC-1296]|uniref:Uncharacterized protein n=1 Tax=Mannheimia varigena USDA-ARS-USMARC-1296 TaxID=1433287 RepID=W0QEI4_9PAST|nr:hypothetical protein [Mannheimia varigena]AHG76285.1 hypothetical protein X808_17650 [Mannheimia varigena USDA-ARS-USMARC-1296]